jgi:hypothetical protein
MEEVKVYLLISELDVTGSKLLLWLLDGSNRGVNRAMFLKLSVVQFVLEVTCIILNCFLILCFKCSPEYLRIVIFQIDIVYGNILIHQKVHE